MELQSPLIGGGARLRFMANVIQPQPSAPVGFVVLSPSGLAATASPLLADNIDPQTQDFNSLVVGIDPVDAQVINALKIVRGSGPAVIEDGIDTTGLRKMDESAQTRFSSRIREALKRLISNGDILLLTIIFPEWDESSQTGNTHVEYKNLRSRKKDIRRATMMTAGSEEV